MTEDFLLNNQFQVIFSGFFWGGLFASVLLALSQAEKTWRIVDLVWISVGGISAATAFLSSLYLSDVGDTQRSVSVLQSKVANLNSEARTVSAKYCSTDANRRLANFYNGSFDQVCLGINSIAAETSDSSRAFELVNLVTESSRSTSIWEQAGNSFIEDLPNQESGNDQMSWSSTDTADQKIKDLLTLETSDFAFSKDWGAVAFFGFDPTDPMLDEAYDSLIASGVYREFAVEFDTLRREFVSLKSEFDRLEQTWEDIREDRTYLSRRTLALAMLAFCLPLRIGKSIFEIRKK